ncbi:MAG TPA: efflux RND transporter periplasmic adaptor subunit [Kofleriaceae bacterium]|nr:efflux RND transporter periplasmic adaptor subunit [Kofleriaceae bacterium]
MSSRAITVLVRVVIAIAVIAGLVWWLQSRGHKSSARTAAPVARGVDATGARPATGDPGPRSGGDRVVPVQVATAERKDLPIWIEGLGTVAAFQQVTVRAQVDGRLDKVLFTEGQAVKKGDVLAQIDPRPFMVQLHQAQGALARDKAQLEAAKRNYERYKGLADQKLVAQQQVEEYGAQVGQYDGAIKIDLAAVEQAQLQLDYAQVKAPIDGVTGVRLVDAGNLIKASDPTGLVVITAVDPAAVMFTVPQDRLTSIASALAKGDVDVEVWNRDGSESLAKGKLAVLDNQINQATATLRLKAIVPNPKRVLWPNAFVKARMLVETRSGALVVPAVAVQRGPQGSFVYVVGADKTAAMKQVQVSLLTGDVAVIASGLDGGEQVVVEGANQLRPGGRVEPITPGADRGKATGSAAGPTASVRPAAP